MCVLGFGPYRTIYDQKQVLAVNRCPRTDTRGGGPYARTRSAPRSVSRKHVAGAVAGADHTTSYVPSLAVQSPALHALFAAAALVR